jgi:crossover junction endodeoxyribonuclease RuvC
MIILGIDPGLRTTGFGVIEKHGNGCAISRPAPSRPAEGALPPRLKIILSGVSEVVATYKPACAAIEKVFVNVNPQSTLLLGAGARRRHHGAGRRRPRRGGIHAGRGQAGRGRHGKAVKAQVQDMVARLLKLPGLPGSDAADALGIAICHAHGMDALALIGARSGAGKTGPAHAARPPCLISTDMKGAP